MELQNGKEIRKGKGAPSPRKQVTDMICVEFGALGLLILGMQGFTSDSTGGTGLGFFCNTEQ
jgi:hypothetical protein